MSDVSQPGLRMERDMPLGEVERISAEIIDLISRGQSLALATNYAYTHVGTNNPEEVAVQYMTPSERYQYRAAKSRGVPFKVNIERDRLESPDGAKQFPRMALALDRIFNTSGHTRENVAFIYRRLPGHIPLVKAYLKVINAERDAISNADVSLDLFQEYQTCRKVLGNAQYVFQHSPVDLREQSVLIRRMQTIMERRMADLAGSKLRASKRSNQGRHSYPDHYFPDELNELPENSRLPPSPQGSHAALTPSRLHDYGQNHFGKSVGPAKHTAYNFEPAVYKRFCPSHGLTTDFEKAPPLLTPSPTPPIENMGDSSVPFDCKRTTSRYYFEGKPLYDKTASFTPASPPYTYQTPTRPVAVRPSGPRSPSVGVFQPARSRFFPTVA